MDPPSKSATLVIHTDRRVPELDGLRGIAIALVVLFHCLYYAPGPSYRPGNLIHVLYLWFERVIAVGWTGVDLFFVLSGFLIGGILLDARDSRRYYRTFYLRRFFRIIPVYYAWIIAYVTIEAFAGTFLRNHIDHASRSLGLGPLLAQFLFLQNFGILNSYGAIGSRWFGPTWSLAVEEQFYLLAPAAIRYLSKRGLFILTLLVILLAPFLRVSICYLWPAQKIGLGMVYTLMPCRADSLGIGVLAALLWREERSRDWLTMHARTLYILMCVFLAGFIVLARWWPSNETLPMQSVGYTWIAVFFALVLLLALAKPTGPVARLGRRSWLRELGRVSYCLYLIHMGLLLICAALLNAAHKRGPEEFLARILVAVVSYGVARASWVYFEHPLVRIGHTFKY